MARRYELAMGASGACTTRTVKPKSLGSPAPNGAAASAGNTGMVAARSGRANAAKAARHKTVRDLAVFLRIGTNDWVYGPETLQASGNAWTSCRGRHCVR